MPFGDPQPLPTSCPRTCQYRTPGSSFPDIERVTISIPPQRLEAWGQGHGQSAGHRAWLCENGPQAGFLDDRSIRLSSRDSLLTVGCWGHEGETVPMALCRSMSLTRNEKYKTRIQSLITACHLCKTETAAFWSADWGKLHHHHHNRS